MELNFVVHSPLQKNISKNTQLQLKEKGNCTITGSLMYQLLKSEVYQ